MQLGLETYSKLEAGRLLAGWLAAWALTGIVCIGARAQYRFDSWATDDGLPQSSVLAIAQTRDGYLWLTTFNGLARFDGVRFTVFDRNNSPGMSANDCTVLHEDAAGALWIGTGESGVMRYQNGVFTSFTTAQGLPRGSVRGIQSGPAGELMVLTGWGAAWLRNGRFVAEPGSEFVMHLGRSGTRWSLDKDGLHARKEDQVTHYRLPRAPDRAGNNLIYEDRRGDVWLSLHGYGVLKARNGVIVDYTGRLRLSASQRVMAILEDREGVFWFGTDNAGLIRFRDEPGADPTRYTTADGLSDNTIYDLFQDREGTLWIGTGAGGLISPRPQFISGYSTAQGLGGNITHTVLQDHAGNVWVATNAGLSKIARGAVTNYTAANGMPVAGPKALFEDRARRLWIGGYNGLSYFRDGVFSPVIPDLNVWAILEDSRGRLWVGTHFGLFEFPNGGQGGARTGYTRRNGLPHDTVRAIHEDRNGALWFGTEGGLVKLHDDRLTVFTIKDGLTSNHIWTIHEDATGTLWLGTLDGGLNRFKDGRFTGYTTAQGFYDNSVFQILEDAGGNFWMSCFRGLYSISKQQLNDFADGKLRAVRCAAYGSADGMLNSNCNGGRQPSGIKTADGRLWFTTLGGVAVVTPEAAPFNPLPPPVRIEEVKIDNAITAFNVGHDEIRLLPGQANLEIRYTGLSFVKPDQVQFRYQLVGQDQDWVEAGARRTANYSYLQPGAYNFRVLAANSDGVWNEAGASLRVVVLPPFYRTWWFGGLVALATAGIIAMVFRLRVSKLRKEHATREAFSRQLLESQEAFSRRLIESQEGERKRIAAELHDSLGQSLAIIKNRALHSLADPDDHDRAREQIEEIAEAAGHAIQETREIAYNLRPFHIDRLGLTAALAAMIKRASSDNLQFTTELDSIDGLLAPEQEINFYRIVQESVNNIIKHSGAGEASVAIKRRDGMIELTIADNGRGFEVGRGGSRNAESGSGFGLLGMTERARILGCVPVITSAPGKGTTIKLKLAAGRREQHNAN
ncbi:MAG: hypothetical protein IPM66_02340 [Acidobacteriota bacterium]|nr:MAG: hypothetical protein IPM66_02340 [Acidobacteriota bacterium]